MTQGRYQGYMTTHIYKRVEQLSQGIRASGGQHATMKGGNPEWVMSYHISNMDGDSVTLTMCM